MSLIFHLRGDSLDARVSQNGKTPSIYRSSGLTDPSIDDLVSAGVFGSKVINLTNTSFLRSLAYPARGNWSLAQPFSVRMRIVPAWTGNPGASVGLICVSADGFLKANHFELAINTSGKLTFFATDRFGATILNFNSTVSPTIVSGTPTDLMFAWSGLLSGSACKISQDGVEIEVFTPSAARIAPPVGVGSISIGNSPNGARGNYKLNELEIYDTAEAHVYTARTAWTTSTAFDGEQNTDPGQANTRLNTGYFIAGVAKTGSAAIPSAANTRNGVAVDATTGSLVVPASTDVRSGTPVDAGNGSLIVPAADDVRDGVQVDADVGTLIVPIASDVREGVDVDDTVGTLRVVTNYITETSVETQGARETVYLNQGDALTLSLIAKSGDTAFDLTGAVFETKLQGAAGELILFDAAHEAAADQVANTGKFNLVLSTANTRSLRIGATLYVVKVTQGSLVKHFFGKLSVQSNHPSSN